MKDKHKKLHQSIYKEKTNLKEDVEELVIRHVDEIYPNLVKLLNKTLDRNISFLTKDIIQDLKQLKSLLETN